MNIRRTAILLPWLLLAITAAGMAAKPNPSYDVMLAAAMHAHDGARAIYLQKAERGLFDETLDPNFTGLVGAEYSDATTTLGALKAKRSATNPDFAAYLVKLLIEKGITEQDCVLVTMTGSFPGLNLALVSALETLNIPSLRIISLGASSYGANQQEMTWIDMEEVLIRDNLLTRRSDYATLGGTGDVGRGMPDDVQALFKDKCIRLGYPLLQSESLSEQLDIRRELLGNPRAFALLINVGGNHLMLGNGSRGRELPGGWIDPKSKSWKKSESGNPGIVFDFLNAEVPVLNLLHVEEIANAAGIPFDPQPLPKAGTSAVYFDSGR